MPKVNAIFLLETTAVHSESPYSSVLASIFCDAVTEFGLEFSYAASMAGLHGHFSNSRHGFSLDVSGYNHKVPVLLKHLVDTIKTTSSRLTPELFERLREKREKNLLEFFVSQPYRHAINALDLLVERPKWDFSKRLECVKEVTLEDLKCFSRRALARFRLKGLVHGNVSPKEATDLVQVVLDGFQPKCPLLLPEIRVSQLAVGETIYRQAGYNKDEVVSCAVSLYQMGSMDLTVNAALSVLNHLVTEPAYSVLR
jgi:secreted Zn-dependent insulinase-like peptidase